MTVSELAAWFCDDTEQLHFRIIRNSSRLGKKQVRLKCTKGSEAGRVSFQSDLTPCAYFTVPFTLQRVGWFLTEQDAREEMRKGWLTRENGEANKGNCTTVCCALLFTIPLSCELDLPNCSLIALVVFVTNQARYKVLSKEEDTKLLAGKFVRSSAQDAGRLCALRKQVVSPCWQLTSNLIASCNSNAHTCTGTQRQ